MKIKSLLSLTLLVMMAWGTADAQFFPTRVKPNQKPTEKSDEKKDGKEFQKIKAKSKEIPGLFPLWQDTTNGSIYMWVKEDQINKEFIHFSQVADGVLGAGFFRGSYRGSRIIRVERYFDHIDFRRINTSYFFDENNALSKAESANINNPVLFSTKIIESSDENGHLIKVDDLFVSESLGQVKPTPNPKDQGFSLGGFDKSLSRVDAVRNYPKNTDVKVTLVYKNPYPKGYAEAVTDPRMVEVGMYQSLIAMPENDYTPRRDDPRIGYFTTQREDMTSLGHTPYKDMIHRWYLKKQNPDAELSEPVEPIVWWIENTTPEEYREIIRTGVLRWNKAFEAVGFKNAVQVRVQPDTASWDAGDIRYNVLRWTSSPTPPFGGYGPSFVNPRTGQILGADIMLEWVSIANRLKREELFATAGLSMFSEEDAWEEDFKLDPHLCFVGDMMNQQTVFANTAFDALELSDIAKKDFVKQILYRLVLHEVGHTLGLNHNMKASSWMSYEDIKNPEKVRKHGLCNSVMEYPAINFPLNKANHTKFYDDEIGPYDMWVINYGYSPGLEYTQEEELRLQAILKESTKPEHMFGNDADDMRSPGKGIDPRVNIYDLSSDPVAYAIDRIKLVNTVMPNILTKIPQEGESYHRLRNAYLGLTAEMATALSVISKQIGGVYVNRSLVGQEDGAIPYTAVPYNKQKEAMNAIVKYALAADAFEEGEKLYRYLQPQRRGFNFFSETEDPKLHERWLSIQKSAIAHVMHPRVTERMTDASMYGNKYSVAEAFGDLTEGIFTADRYKSVATNRQNIQTYYVEKLANIMGDKSRYDSVTKAAALAQLKRIKSLNASASKPDESTKAHREYVAFLINKALDTSR
ncbi:MAG: zinc-dependent metalloprotease [Luteibaculum sp.]